jgi:adenylate cyclase
MATAISYPELASPSTGTAQPPQSSVEAARKAAASPTSAISIAVLPFTNMSGDAGQEFFSDGMTEEITAALATAASFAALQWGQVGKTASTKGP